MKAIFIRHGESTANTGLVSTDVASIALTERGEGQAGRIAREWPETPSLIVTSPFQRTRQTAAPTIARFPDAPVEVWPIEEFTYLQPARWNGTAAADRRPHVERYWTVADPAWCDGEGAESFAGFLRRVEAALARLAALPPASRVYVFGHGQFIQAARAIVTGPDLDDQAQMRAFWRDGTPPVVANAERVGFHCLVIAGNVRRPSPPDGNTCLSLSSFRVTLLRVTRIKAKRGRLRKGAESYGKARI